MADLIFKSLTVENFKTFSGQHEIKLDRQPGLYYITGQNKLDPELGANGVGKSTIWDALFWCLFGKTIRDNRPANAIQPWNGKGKTQVQCWFNRNGQDCFVYRTRSPNSLRVSVDSSDDDKEVQQEEIPKLLGMSEEMFRRTIILGQFGTMFLDLRPDQQSQMFTEALDLDIWLKAIDVVGTATRKAEADARAVEIQMETNRARKEDIVKNIEDTKARIDVFEADKQAKITKIRRGVETLEADLKNLKVVAKPEQIDSSVLDILRDKLGPLKDELLLLRRDVESNNYDNEKLGKEIDAAEQQKDKKCPTCGQVINSKKARELIDDLLDRAKALKTQEENTRVEAEDINKRVNVLCDKIKAEEEKLKTARMTFNNRLDAYNKFIREQSSICGELNRQKRDLLDANAMENHHMQLLDEAIKRRDKLRQEVTDLKGKLESAQKELDQAKFWVEGFREIRLSIIDQTLIELEMAASRHAAMLGLNDWGIKFDTERETQSGKVSHGFNVMLYPPGQDDPVKWESYSGGESQRWQLSVSFALSEVLLARAGLSPNVEILDEPTRGLSAAGVSDLLDHLRDRALELGRSVFFVDHHSLDKGAFDGTLMITKTNKGSSMQWL